MDKHDPSVVRITLKHSNTDPYQHGVNIFLGRTSALPQPYLGLGGLCQHNLGNNRDYAASSIIWEQ